ncbi:hypothetical protein ACRYCC_27355 [Actinomadura scrupuli]|uniref:hypothetical protein n=1 Tax=Actinomadura scrupuli TaxID=559629 RepID=UPI003D964D6A
MNYQFSDAVLGAGAYSDGLDASKLQRRHKGVGILLGADDGELAEEGGQVERTYLMDGPALTGIVERARELRIAAGTLTGTAAGEEVITEKPVTNLLIRSQPAPPPPGTRPSSPKHGPPNSRQAPEVATSLASYTYTDLGTT